jgi:hypothetical protein
MKLEKKRRKDPFGLGGKYSEANEGEKLTA